MNAYRFEHPGWCGICEADVTFTTRYDWFRDHLMPTVILQYGRLDLGIRAEHVDVLMRLKPGG